MADKRDPLDILSELRKRALVDEPDWILRLDQKDNKKKSNVLFQFFFKNKEPFGPVFLSDGSKNIGEITVENFI